MQDPAALPRVSPEERERNKKYWDKFKADASACEEPSLSEGEGGESAEGEEDPVVEPDTLEPQTLFDSQQEEKHEEGGLDDESSGSETLELNPHPKPYKKSSSSHMDVDAVEAAYEGDSILNV